MNINHSDDLCPWCGSINRIVSGICISCLRHRDGGGKASAEEIEAVLLRLDNAIAGLKVALRKWDEEETDV